MHNMAEAGPMHKAAPSCFLSRQREREAKGAQLVASAFAARSSAMSCAVSGPRVVRKRKTSVAVAAAAAG
jgi:hypothetical protein